MSEKSVSISIAIDVEADEITVVIEAIDGGGANAVGGVDGLPLGMLRWIGQQELVRLGRAARADRIGSDDLVRCVDAAVK
jgi:hypothetical protein